MHNGALWAMDTPALFPREVGILSEDLVIQMLFSNIPFLGIGVLAFGVFTFFIVAKRINFAACALYSSALFAFVAALLDLGQIILRRDVSVSSASVTAIRVAMVANKVTLAASLSLRFLFFWKFVSQRPSTQEESAEGPQIKVDTTRWEDWGLVGTFLQWFTLSLVLAIFVLQTVWRLVPQFNQFSSVFMADMTVEIIVSAIFFLKLVMNSYLSLMPWQTTRRYICAFIGLAFSLGIAIGNLVSFGFSDTTLGRFLQALLAYVLILFLLISTFPSKSSRPLSSFDGVVPPPIIFEKTSEPPAFQVRRNSRFSINTHISSLYTRRQSRRGSGVERLWNSSQADDTSQIFDEAIEDAQPVEITKRPFSSQLQKSNRSSIAFINRPTTGGSFSSYYMTEPVMPAAAASRSLASPVYGLNGIIARSETDVELGLKAKGSMSSLDDLLRQQQELDESIQTLRLFSPPASKVFEPLQRLQKPVESALSFDSLRSNPRIDSIARSDFSTDVLTLFPEPPLNFDLAAPPPGRTETKPSIDTTVVSIPKSPSEFSPPEGSTYNITSFVAAPRTPETGLTETSSQTGLMTGAFRNAILPVEEWPESTNSSTFGTSAGVESATFPPATASSGVLSNRESRFKPLMLSPVPEYTSTRRVLKSDFKFQTKGIRKNVIGLPSRPGVLPRPKMQISGPRLFTPEPRLSDNLTFERPRPPPFFEN